jgi:hypothetical protein
MAYPQNPYLKNRYYNTATTSTSGAPTSTVVVASRCKYMGGYYVPNQLASSPSGNTFDVITITQASSVFLGAVTVIASGVGVTTSTGTLAIPFGPIASSTSTASAVSSGVATFLNPGDLIVTLGSSLQGGYVTHVVGEF